MTFYISESTIRDLAEQAREKASQMNNVAEANYMRIAAALSKRSDVSQSKRYLRLVNALKKDREETDVR